ncbi:MAG: 50S ribosomal protein L22 [Actinomycetaceae bacterium]|nr:50S ribosomal protein L22 [Arcanobacterium sp.]MDD7465379.1 50S ribosomal protein L22 [Actinomycetaceae bacterium]MDY5854798.1 50S ribosomal protein L22 [Arcanobacterium sp.]
MEAKAQAKYVRVTPQKSRRVINEIRGKRVLDAVDVLTYAPQAVARDIKAVLLSAVANARFKADEAGERFDEEALRIVAAYADEGPTMKRIRPRARGRAARILKRTSHITVVVSDGKSNEKEA